MAGTQIALLALLAVTAIVLVVRFEQLCLGDLAQTPNDQLRLFTRTGWTALILVCIPIGGVLYVSVGKWR